jgi:Ca2+-binding RTX toxin-like protein
VIAHEDDLVEDDETVLVRVSGYVDWIIPTILGEDVLNLQGNTVLGLVERSFVDFSVNTTINSAPVGDPAPILNYTFTEPEIVVNVLNSYSDGSEELFSVVPVSFDEGLIVGEILANGDLQITDSTATPGQSVVVRFDVEDERGAVTSSEQEINFGALVDDYLPGDGAGVFGAIVVGTPEMGSVERPEDKDRFQVELEAGQVYSISLDSATTASGTLVDPEIFGLFDNLNTQLSNTSDTDSGTGSNALVAPFVVDTSGIYEIEVGGQTNFGTGGYILSIDNLGAADDYLPGTFATSFGMAVVGVPVGGSLETDGDRDRFDVTLQAGVIYEISLEGSATGGGFIDDPEIIGVFNSSGQLVANSADDNSGINANALVDDLIVDADGIYQIEVAGAGDINTGDYTLSVQSGGFVDDFLPGISGGFGSVSINGRTTGEIETIGDIDGFSVSLQADTTYEISILGIESNNGTLSDPDLVGIFASIDFTADAVSSVQTLNTQFAGVDSVSYFTPQSAGAYFIGVQDAFGGTGSYTVAVDDIGVRDDFTADIDTTGSIVSGGSAVGQIQFTQDEDWFEVTLAANRLYEIELVPTEGGDALADPFFKGVYDSDGVLIENTENDDGRTGTSSSLQFVTDNPGTFYLSAGAFDDVTGEYRLELNDLGRLDDDRFNITIEYTSEDTPNSYITAFEDAVERWEQVIVGDLDYGFVEGYGFVDDILIEVDVTDIDLVLEGVEHDILAISTVLDQRADAPSGEGALPTYARIVLNELEIGNVQNLEDIAANAIGRALGFGSLWEEFGLVQDFGGIATYTGPNALRELQELSDDLNGQNALEDGADGGLAAEYWSEEIFGNELMTSSIGLRSLFGDPANPLIPDNPLTSLTVAAMEDLGYLVNYAAADNSFESPPVVVGDTITTTEDTAVTFMPLGNDSDPEGGSLTIVEVTQGTGGGSVTIVNGTTLEYTPGTDANGDALETATYTVEDETGLRTTGTLTFNVTPVNDAPVIAAIPDAALNAGETFSYTIDVSDKDGDVVTVDLGQSTVPDWLTFDGDRTFSGTPDADDIAQSTVIIAVEDAQGATAEQSFGLVVSSATPGQNLIGVNGLDVTLIGDEGPDQVRGGSGNDVLRGNAGGDLLQGGDGRDTIFGNDGNAILIGGPGNNVLIGGAGRDTFVVTPGSTTRILDFEEGVDRIVIEDMSSPFNQNTLVPSEGVFGTSALGPFSNLIVRTPGDGGGTILTAFDKDERETTVELNVPNANNPVFEGSGQVSTNPLFESKASLLNSLSTLSGTAEEVFEKGIAAQDTSALLVLPTIPPLFQVDADGVTLVPVVDIVSFAATVQVVQESGLSTQIIPSEGMTFEGTFDLGLATPGISVPIVDSLSSAIPQEAQDDISNGILNALQGDTNFAILLGGNRPDALDDGQPKLIQTTKLRLAGDEIIVDEIVAEASTRGDLQTDPDPFAHAFFDNETGRWTVETPDAPISSGDFEPPAKTLEDLGLAADDTPDIEVAVDVEATALATGKTVREIIEGGVPTISLQSQSIGQRLGDSTTPNVRVSPLENFPDADVTSELGSFVFNFDLDSNGVVDISVKIEGDYDDARFRNLELGDGTLGFTPYIENADPFGAPVITGVLLVGETLTADLSNLFDADGIDGATVTYQWLRDGDEIVGATDETFTLAAEDIGAEMSVVVSYTDGFGTDEVETSPRSRPILAENTPAQGTPVITGDTDLFGLLRVDLTNVEDPDGILPTSVSYQWFSNGVPVPGATDPILIVSPSLTNTQVTVQFQYVDGTGALETLLSSPVYLSNTINGTNNPDTLMGTSANEIISGGNAFDTLELQGRFAEYSVILSPGGIYVGDRVNDRDGIDQIASVEGLGFLDNDFPLDKFADIVDLPQEDFSTFIEMYIAYFNRAPDSLGLFFWANALSTGTPLDEIAELFFDQDETRSIYGDEITDIKGFAEQVYQNVLGREFDQSGLDFWVGVLESGAVALPTFMLEIIFGAKAPAAEDATQAFKDQKAADVAYLSDKGDLGTYFSAIKGMSDVDNARAAMSLFDGSAASVTAAKDAIDAFYADAVGAVDGEFLISVVGVVDDPFTIV